jgi:hypothetical protein
MKTNCEGRLNMNWIKLSYLILKIQLMIIVERLKINDFVYIDIDKYPFDVVMRAQEILIEKGYSPTIFNEYIQVLF